jgi:hypothetical protein
VIPKESGGGSSSGAASYVSFAVKFGTFEGFEQYEVPEEFTEHEPVAQPAWLEQTLEFKDDTADWLVDQVIAYRFEPTDGGWAMGKIVGVLDDEDDTVEVTLKDERGRAAQGYKPKNYLVEFEDGRERMLLLYEMYATSITAETGFWVLLSVPPKTKSKGKGGKGKAVDMDNMSLEEKKKLLQRLQEELDVP